MEIDTPKKGAEHRRLWRIFVSCLTISAFTFGGGYTIISLIKKKFVDELGWLDKQEMMNLIAVAQASPGAMAVNTAVLVGHKICGLAGAFCAMLGTVIPPIFIITLVSFVYTFIIENRLVLAVLKGMQAGVAAIICDVVFTMSMVFFKGGKWRAVLNTALMLVSFCLIFFLSVNPAFIVGGCVVLGIAVFLIGQARAKRAGNRADGDEGERR